MIGDFNNELVSSSLSTSYLVQSKNNVVLFLEHQNYSYYMLVSLQDDSGIKSFLTGILHFLIDTK